MNTLKKFVVYTVALTTVLSLSGVLVAPSASAASAGDLIKGPTAPDSYYLGSDSKRYVFAGGLTGHYPVYSTWYSSYSGIKTVSQSELEGYSLGGNVCVRPGTNLVKIKTDPKTYAVEKGCVLRHVTSEAIAKSLWGDKWYLKVMETPDYLFVNYTVGSDISSATYPSGALVKTADSGTVYLIDGSTKRPVATEAAFNANNFNWKYLVVASSLAGYSDGSSLTGYEAAVGTVAGPGVTPSVTGGALSVFLAPDTPAAATVVQSAQRQFFTKIGFTASSAGDATVDSMVVRRTGLAQDSNFSDILLIDAATGAQVGNEKSLGSTHEATFNDDLLISAGTTKYYYLAANMASTLQSGEAPKLALASVTLKGSSTLSGSLPIEGNAMTMNTSISIGTVTVAAGGLNPSAQSKEVGTSDYVLSSVRLTINSTEDVNVEAFRFYQNGTAADADVKDLELVVDGVVVAGPAQVSNKEVLFNFASPIKITKGTNKEFSLRGDIANGSSRTISFDFEKKTDLRAKGLTYGFYINPTYPNSSTPYFNAADTTIATGSLTASKAVTASSNVAEGVTQQEVGAFYLQAQGEEVQVSRLSINFVVSGTGNAQDITNVTVLDSSGKVVGGPADPSSTGQTATTTDTFIVPVGLNKYSIKADLNTDFAANDTVQVRLLLPGTYITSKGVSTNNTITPTPSTTVSLDTVTVKVGALSARTSTSPAAQTVIAGVTGFTFANFILDASQSGEDVNVTQLAVRHTTSAAAIHSDITNITLYDGATALNTPQAGTGSTTTANATSTITLSSPLKIAKGTTKTLALKGNISGSASNGSTRAFSLVSSSAVTATGASTANSITPSVTNSDGQLMTVATAGTLTLYAAGANPLSGFVTANSTGNTAMVFAAKADYEDIEVQDMAFTFADVNGSNTQNNIDFLYLYDESTLVGSVPVVGAIATITPSNLVIPANVTKNLTVKIDTKEVGPNKPGGAGNTFTFSIATTGNYVVKGKASGSTSVTKSGTPATNQLTIAKTVPSVTKGSVSGVLASGAGVPLGRFTVAANAKGDVGFYKAAFTLSTTTATITNVKIYENPDGTIRDLTNNAAREVSETLTAASGNPLNGGVYGYDLLFDTGTDGVGNGGEFVIIPAGGSRVYEIRGDITGVTTGSTVVVTLRGDAAFPGTYPNCAGTTAGGNACTGIDSETNDSFIWSDLNYGNSSTTVPGAATNTAEWFNGFRIFSTTTLQALSK